MLLVLTKQMFVVELFAWLVQYLWVGGARRGYRHNSPSKDTLGHLSFSSRHYGAGGVVAVEVCVVFEPAIVVEIVRGGSHAVSLFVPWFDVQYS